MNAQCVSYVLYLSGLSRGLLADVSLCFCFLLSHIIWPSLLQFSKHDRKAYSYSTRGVGMPDPANPYWFLCETISYLRCRSHHRFAHFPRFTFGSDDAPNARQSLCSRHHAVPRRYEALKHHESFTSVSLRKPNQKALFIFRCGNPHLEANTSCCCR